MNTRITTFSLFVLILLLGTSAHADWLNQKGNGDSNSNYIGIGAASGTTAAVCGFMDTGSSPQVLYATTSDGDIWNDGMSFTGYGAALEFANESVGFIGGLIGKVWRTTDGGASWMPMNEATVGGGTIMDAEWVADVVISDDGQTVWILGGSGKCSYSNDQGATWAKIDVSVPDGADVTSGAIIGDEIWIAGGVSPEEPVEGSDFEDPTPGHPAGSGFLMHSVDGGASFDTIASGLEYQLTEISFVNPAEGWASGGTFEEGGAAVGKTSDGGATWEFSTMPDFPEGEVVGVGMGASVVSGGCQHVEFFGREVGVAVCSTSTFEFDGSTGLFLTVDGGETWEHQLGYKDAFAQQLVAASAINDVAMADCHRGWLAGAGKVIQRWDNPDQDLDCEQGGAPSEEVPDDVDDPNGDGDGGGGGCGCDTVSGGSSSGLLSILLNVLFPSL